jgi:hypothetical protein
MLPIHTSSIDPASGSQPAQAGVTTPSITLGSGARPSPNIDSLARLEVNVSDAPRLPPEIWHIVMANLQASSPKSMARLASTSHFFNARLADTSPMARLHQLQRRLERMSNQTDRSLPQPHVSDEACMALASSALHVGTLPEVPRVNVFQLARTDRQAFTVFMPAPIDAATVLAQPSLASLTKAERTACVASVITRPDERERAAGIGQLAREWELVPKPQRSGVITAAAGISTPVAMAAAIAPLVEFAQLNEEQYKPLVAATVGMEDQVFKAISIAVLGKKLPQLGIDERETLVRATEGLPPNEIQATALAGLFDGAEALAMTQLSAALR